MHTRRKQSGMTLIIGLMLLIMLSMIGVIGYRNTTLTERMAGNVQDKNISFQSAESAAKEALTFINAGSFTGSVAGEYSPSLSLGGNSSYWTQGDGSAIASTACTTATSFGWLNCSKAVGSKYSNNARTATYVIELLSSVPASATETLTQFRVTARSLGGSGNAESIVQVHFSRVTSP
jgi:type IV pilus assembly protein PilX